VPQHLEDPRVQHVAADDGEVARRLGGVGLLDHGGDAHDVVLGESVAVKVLRCTEAEAARARREISILRALRLPGVVRLLDEGTSEGQPFLVMERVSGLAFPGRTPEPVPEAPAEVATLAQTQSTTAGPTLGSMRSIDASRLFPAAVATTTLQDRRGRWTWQEIAERAEALLEILARVHAAGVIHRDLKPANILVNDENRLTVLDFGLSVGAGRDERLTAQGKILGTPAYLAPEQIRGGQIDERADLYAVGVMLYEALAGRRPHEAKELAALLVARLVEPPPHINDVNPDVPPVIAELIDRMLAIEPEGRPRSAIEALSVMRGQPVDRRASFGVYGLGGDAPARAVLDAAREGRTDLAARLEPLTEEAMMPLFHGPDRLFHLREDAARIIFARTGGLPARVVIELEAWVRAGLARWNGSSFVIDRDALDRLASGLEVAPLTRRPAWVSADPIADEILRWLALAGHVRRPKQLAMLTGHTPRQLKAALDTLLARGAVRRSPSGGIVVQERVEIDWSPEERRIAHSKIAASLDVGEEGRLIHLLAADERCFVAAEARALSRRRAEEGQLGPAMMALQEGLLAVRRWSPDAVHPSEESLLAQTVKLAFAERTEPALDRALYEVCRTAARDLSSAGVAHLKGLLEAGLVALSPRGRQALSMANALPPFDDPEIERWRQWVRVRGALRASPEVLSKALVSTQAWAAHSGSSLARASLAGWMGILRYSQDRFDEAAQLHTEAAEGEPWFLNRIDAMLNGASALLEAFRHREAAERAGAALRLAARCRHAYLEGRAEWLVRAVLYRMETQETFDCEFIEAVKAVGVPELEALVCLNEASIAWRSGHAEQSAELAGRAARIWKGSERPWPELLARCLAAVSESITEPEVRDLAERAARCPVMGVGIQALGLLGLAYPWLRPLPQAVLDVLCAGIPKVHWERRIDVISVSEALRWTSAHCF